VADPAGPAAREPYDARLCRSRQSLVATPTSADRQWTFCRAWRVPPVSFRPAGSRAQSCAQIWLLDCDFRVANRLRSQADQPGMRRRRIRIQSSPMTTTAPASRSSAIWSRLAGMMADCSAARRPVSLIRRNPAAISGPSTQQLEQKRHASHAPSQITLARLGDGQPKPGGGKPYEQTRVHMPQSKGPFQDRKRPLTCGLGSGGRI
jgi:hypothetical protein